MSHEQYLTLDLIARLAGRFGPTSRVAKELPGWLEYLTEVDCPERPRSRPGGRRSARSAEVWCRRPVAVMEKS